MSVIYLAIWLVIGQLWWLHIVLARAARRCRCPDRDRRQRDCIGAGYAFLLRR